MFTDSLVESTENTQRGRSSKFVVLTGLAYCSVLFVFAILSVVWLNPSLADELSIDTMLVPPLPQAAEPQVATPRQERVKSDPVVTTFTPPAKAPESIPDPMSVKSEPVIVSVSHGIPNGVPGAPVSNVFSPEVKGPEPLPPPPPRPTPMPEPTLKPEPPKQIKVSGGVLAGTAISKVQPVYPLIAKAARASGAVLVQVLISEEGQVIEASVVGGHPLLREASLQAARQWKFKPTELTGVPVKVQGILTFNFTLQ